MAIEKKRKLQHEESEHGYQEHQLQEQEQEHDQGLEEVEHNHELMPVLDHDQLELYDVSNPHPQQEGALVEIEGSDLKNEEEEEEDEDDITKLLEPLSREHLIGIINFAAHTEPTVVNEIYRLVDIDPSFRKIFVHGLNWSTTADVLRSIFSKHGDIEDCRVVSDRNTGKSKGYGFVLFRHRKDAKKALKYPQNLIDGRMTACQLASVGPTAPQQGHMMNPVVQSQGGETAPRKIFVGNVHTGIDGTRLLDFFSKFGEIEEGPLGFDRQTGKPKGFALFIYRTVEGAKKALEEPNKVFEGQTLYCQRASEGHKNKVSASGNLSNRADLGFGGNAGYNMGGSGRYNVSGGSGAYNGGMDMGMSQGVMNAGSMQYGQGMQQANTAALAMLAAAGQNPAAFGVSPAFLASFNPALAAAMGGGNPPIGMQTSMAPPGYGMGNSTYPNAVYQGPQPAVNPTGAAYQGPQIGQTPSPMPPMGGGHMGGYRPH